MNSDEVNGFQRPLADTLALHAERLRSAPTHTPEDEAERTALTAPSNEPGSAEITPATRLKGFNASAWLARRTDRLMVLLYLLVIFAIIVPERRPPTVVLLGLMGLIGVGLKSLASVSARVASRLE